MVIDGRHVRFCQQCGRFQPIADFDTGRKSCRKKLESHNQRRKLARAAASQGPDPALLLLEPSQRRARRHNASFPATTTDTTRTSSPGRSNSQSGMQESVPYHITSSNSPSSSLLPLGLGGNEMEMNMRGAAGAATAPMHPYQHTTTATAAQAFLDASTPTFANAASAMDINNPLDIDAIDAMLGCLGPALDLEAAELGEELLTYAAHNPPTTLDRMESATTSEPTMAHGFVPVLDSHTNTSLFNSSSSSFAPPQPSLIATPSTAPPQLQDALSFLSTHHRSAPAIMFEPQGDLVRASLKLFNAHPSDLPSSIVMELHAMVNKQSMLFSNVRMGCTHITIEMLLTPDEAEALMVGGSKALLDEAVRRGNAVFPSCTFEGPNGRVLAQLGEDIYVLTNTMDVNVRLGENSLATPHVRCVVPFAAVPSEHCGLTALGSSVAGPQDMVVCRRGGVMPDLEVVRSGRSRRGEEFVDFVIPRLQAGLHFVEVQRGALLSGSAPFLVVDCADAVSELRQLEYDPSGVGDGHAVASFLRNVGVVLEFVRRSSSSNSPGEELSPSDTAMGPDTAQRVAEMAVRVAATCVGRGWPSLLRLVLPACVVPGATATATASVTAVVESFKSLSADGLSLLHLVATSRTPSTIPVLAEWASVSGHVWRCECAGPSALTPLHLAALLNDGGAMASALTSLFADDGINLWSKVFSPKCDYSAATFAQMIENKAVISWLNKHGLLAPESLHADHCHADGGGCSTDHPHYYTSLPAGDNVVGEESEITTVKGAALYGGSGDGIGGGQSMAHRAIRGGFVGAGSVGGGVVVGGGGSGADASRRLIPTKGSALEGRCKYVQTMFEDVSSNTSWLPRTDTLVSVVKEGAWLVVAGVAALGFRKFQLAALGEL